MPSLCAVSRLWKPRTKRPRRASSGDRRASQTGAGKRRTRPGGGDVCWLSKTANQNRDSVLPYIRVCSGHFVSGRPSALCDDANPDWAPSINLGCDGRDEVTTPTGGTQGRKRKRYGREKVLEQVPASSLVHLSDAAHENDEEYTENRKSVNVRTDLSSECITTMQMEIKRLIEENRTLRKQL